MLPSSQLFGEFMEMGRDFIPNKNSTSYNQQIRHYRQYFIAIFVCFPGCLIVKQLE